VRHRKPRSVRRTRAPDGSPLLFHDRPGGVELGDEAIQVENVSVLVPAIREQRAVWRRDFRLGLKQARNSMAMFLQVCHVNLGLHTRIIHQGCERTPCSTLLATFAG